MSDHKIHDYSAPEKFIDTSFIHALTAIYLKAY